MSSVSNRKSCYLYIGYLAILLAVSMGLRREISIWEWYFGPYWYRNILSSRWLLTSLATVLTIIGSLQLFMIRNRLARVLVFLYTMLGIGFIGFYAVFEERLPTNRDAQIVFDGLADMMVIGITVFQNYPWTITLILLAAVVVTTGLLLIGNRAADLPCRPVVPWLAYLFYAVGFAYFLFIPAAQQPPIYIYTPVLFIRSASVASKEYRGVRAAPEQIPVRPDKFSSHIIFIMDESVSGHALGINGYRYDTTPHLDSLEKPHFNNYGIAASAGNYSAVSNLVVISGLQPDQIPDVSQHSIRNASIFGYAKKAGRKTYYIDAQNTFLKNLMYARDLLDMEYEPIQDERHSVPSYKLDLMGARRVAEIIDHSTAPVFVFLLKTGAHYPYFERYPDEVEYPDLRCSDPVLQHYFYAVRWGVDEFFQGLERYLAGKDVIVVYTGDHGQNLNFDGKELPGATLAHGSGGVPDPLEANVPLFIWTFSEKAWAEYDAAGGFNSANFNRSSHFQLFSTLLELMGYEPEGVRSRFGNSLFSEPLEKRFFTTSYFLDADSPSGTKWMYSFD